MEGDAADGVPTLTEDTRIGCVVPGIDVVASTVPQLPDCVAVDAPGEKHDGWFWLGTAEAKAPLESNCKIWRPDPAPCHWLKVICRPVSVCGTPLNKKSWYRTDGSVPSGQDVEHV